MAFNFIWRGDSFRRSVIDEVATRLENAGRVGVQVARSLVPVDTGQTRDSIGYIFSRQTMQLQIYADTFWAVFLEFGTSRMPARPFLRPALNAAGKAFGGSGVNLELGLANAPTKYQAGYRAKHGLHVTVGRKDLFGKRKARLNIGKGKFQ